VGDSEKEEKTKTKKKGTLMRKPKQGELDGLPNRSVLGRLAIKFADLDDQIAGLQSEQKSLMLEMIPLFKESGKKAIQLDNDRSVVMQTKSASTTIRCTHSEKKRNITKDKE